MAFRVEGNESFLIEMTRTYHTIHEHLGEVQSYVIVEGTLTEEIKREFSRQNLKCSMLCPEDICIYYSSQKNEEDLSCLWNEKNSDME